MNAMVELHREALMTAARNRHVHRLAIFGSAARGGFDPAHSDIDVLVEFEPLAPVERAEAFFGLQEDLERLFGARVDLVERVTLRNPFLRQSVESSAVVVYEAA